MSTGARTEMRATCERRPEVQPPEIPGGRSYRGLEGLIDALLDWPLEWQDFSVEPKRVFALDDSRAVVIAVHRGRSRTMGIEVEAEIVWLFSVRMSACGVGTCS